MKNTCQKCENQHEWFRKCFFESSSPVVRKGAARGTWNQVSLRAGPRTVRYNVVKCPTRQRVNFEDTSTKSVESVFVLRPQSGSEHELTDPLTSLRCLAPVLGCMFVWRPNTSFCRCWASALGLFSFSPDCAGSFAGQCRQNFSLVFSVGSLTRLLTCATVSVSLKAHTSASGAVVSLLRNGLESIPCL